ncbi:hypothetical protein GCM10023259_036930 [Thermocatellispora tengchongensis]|uniref:STAS domain-containing protein n=1 Tax=Thermocatellispora tengchongensis TaxID=1073253 RepID=UPI0031EE5832
MDLTVQVVLLDHRVAVVTVAGELDMLTVPLLEAALRDLPESGVRRVVLDVTDLGFCDAAGVHLLQRAHRGLAAAGGGLGLAGAGRILRHLLTLTCVDAIPLYASAAQAIQALDALAAQQGGPLPREPERAQRPPHPERRPPGETRPEPGPTRERGPLPQSGPGPSREPGPLGESRPEPGPSREPGALGEARPEPGPWREPEPGPARERGPLPQSGPGPWRERGPLGETWPEPPGASQPGGGRDDVPRPPRGRQRHLPRLRVLGPLPESRRRTALAVARRHAAMRSPAPPPGQEPQPRPPDRDQPR